MKTKSLFVGDEAEGPDKGVTTLFIPKEGVKNENEVLSYIDKKKINRVYVGAGDRVGVIGREILLVKRLKEKGVDVVCEVDIEEIKNLSAEFLQSVKCVLTVRCDQEISEMSSQLGKVKSIKFVGTNGLVWYEVSEAYFTSLNDKRYKNDKEVVL